MKNIALFCLVSTFTFASQAEIILIDFGKDTLETTITTPNTWNNYSNTQDYRFPVTPITMIENMKDTTGTATIVDLLFLGRTASASMGVGGADYLSSTLSYPTTATRDTLFLNEDGQSVSATFELQGLLNNGFYNLTFYAAVPADRNNTDWTVGGTTVSLNPGNNLANTVTIFNAQADTSGTLGITWASNSEGGPINDSAHWNTLEIVLVPEPSSLILISIAFASLFVMRKRISR